MGSQVPSYWSQFPCLISSNLMVPLLRKPEVLNLHSWFLSSYVYEHISSFTVLFSNYLNSSAPPISAWDPGSHRSYKLEIPLTLGARHWAFNYCQDNNMMQELIVPPNLQVRKHRLRQEICLDTHKLGRVTTGASAPRC